MARGSMASEAMLKKMNQERYDEQRKEYLETRAVKQRIEELLSTPKKRHE